MSRRNGSHKNRLMTSKPDDIALSTAVEDKFLNLCTTYFNMKGVQLFIPPSLTSDMFNWRKMAIRHKNGDFRHAEIELRSLKTVAEWTLAVNSKLRNQESPNVDWRE